MQDAIAAFSHLSPLTQFLPWIMLFLAVLGLCERFNISGVLGFILLGWLLGPNGIGLLDPEAKG